MPRLSRVGLEREAARAVTELRRVRAELVLALERAARAEEKLMRNGLSVPLPPKK
jgi:hypothetical protein